MMKVDDVRRYCGIDDCDEDNDVYNLIQTAKEYLKEADIEESESYRYELAVKRLVLLWHDGEEDIPISLQRLINQLKRSGGS